MNKRAFGLEMEERALEHLQLNYGWKLLERNVHFREGELDLILLDCSDDGRGKDQLVFVEVKARRSSKYGPVVESLTAQKIIRMRRAISRWRSDRKDFRPGRMLFVGVLLDREGRITIEIHPIE